MMPLPRRRFLQFGAAYSSLGVLRALHARASSGSLSVAAWGDYFAKNTLIADFEAATGIAVSLSTYGSNGEIENKLRAAGGRGFDIIFPSADTGPNYYKDDLLQPIDETKFNADLVDQRIYRRSIGMGATHRAERYLIPFDWGTEAITYDATQFNPPGSGLSYGDLFGPGLEKKVVVRQGSVLVSIALYLDAIGAVSSNRGMDLYKSEDDCRRVFSAALDFAVAHKDRIGGYWNNTTEATKAFTEAGCTIGQTWDTTGMLLHRAVDPKWRYAMPKEGGLAWSDTAGIPSGAANIEQAYAFLNFLYTPQAAAAFANATGYNSCAAGVSSLLSGDAKVAFDMAYPDKAAIDNLWWWPMQTAFFPAVRGEFVEKLTNS